MVSYIDYNFKVKEIKYNKKLYNRIHGTQPGIMSKAQKDKERL